MRLTDKRFLAACVLLLGLAATFGAWRLAERYIAYRAHVRFDEETHKIESAIRDRMAVYEQVLLGARGLLDSHEISPNEWHTYLHDLQLKERYPGIQGVGFAPVITAAQKAEHISKTRASGLPDYKIWPEGDREAYAPIYFDDPFAENTSGPLGFDMLSEPTRRDAMKKARDSGISVLTGKVQLKLARQNDPGFLMYLPIYQGGTTPATMDLRRSQLRGYVYIPFRANNLMQAILAGSNSSIDLSIYDGSETNEDALLFTRRHGTTDGAAALSRTVPLVIAGRTWMVVFNSSPEFELTTHDFLPALTLAAGLVISLLLFAITWVIAARREQAARLADKMTAELQEQKISLREMGDRFRTIVQSTNEAIIIFDGDGKIIFCNRGAQRMFDYSEDEMMGQMFTILIPERYRAGNLAGLKRFYEIGELGMIGKTAILIGLRRRYEEFKLELSLTSWKKGEQVFFGGILRDITERVRTEEALRESEARYRDLFENASDMIQSVNPDGSFEYVNAAWMRLLGYTSFDVSRMTVFDAVSPENLDAFSDSFARVLVGGKPEKFETVFLAKDGRRVVVEGSSTCKFAAGKAIAVRSIFRDVTRRREIDRMKDEFVSVISHELRTPLTSIRASLGLLANGVAGKVDDKAQRMLQIAVVNTDRLIRLINDILVVQELASGAIKIDRRPVDVGQLMLRAEDSVRSMAEEARTRLRVTLLQAEISADADRIHQALTNLLSNAIKFSPPESYVTFEAERRGTDVLFRISDNGRGIPSDKLDTIFERFQQVDASDSRDKPGTGLGLAICRSIVEQHEGKIWAESTLGKGSTFSFTIPVSPRAVVPETEELPKAAAS